MVCSGAIIKLIISLVVDAIDLAFGWVPVYGTVFDIGATVIAYGLWGKTGLIHAWEVVAFGAGNGVDAFVPTCTIAGLTEIARETPESCRLP